MSPEATASWRAAWVDALDELELDVERAERLLRGHAEEEPSAQAWVPPALPGPVPHDLRDRAAAILERQLRASGDLGRTIAGNRRQAALAARMDSGGRRERPVFLDRSF